MVTEGEGERGGPYPVLPAYSRVNGGIDVDVAPTTDNRLERDGPIPMFASITATDATDMKIGIGIQRRKELGGGRGLTEEIAGAQIVTLGQVTGDADLGHETRMPIEIADGYVFDRQIVNRAPIRPVQIDFKVPVGCRGP